MTRLLGALSAAGAAWLLARSGPPAAKRLRNGPADGRATPPERWLPERWLPERWLRERRLVRLRSAEAVTLCAAFAAELRAGRLPAPALAAAAGVLPVLGSGLVRAATAVSRGAHLGEEIALAATALRCPRLAVIAAVCAVGDATGSGIADVLDRVGRGFASDDECSAELAALAAGPRATAAVLAGLPLLAVAFATILGLAPTRILFHTVLGGGLWLAAAVLELAGVMWVRRITAGALRG